MYVDTLSNSGNFPPQIQVQLSYEIPGIPPNVLLVISNGSAINFSVIVSDINGDNFTTSVDTFPNDLLSTNMNVDDGFGNYSFSWSIGDPTDLQISIISTDNDGASSQVQLQVSKINYYIYLFLSLPTISLSLSFFPFQLSLIIFYIDDNKTSCDW